MSLIGLMRCYYVFVHGKLEWLVPATNPEETSQPRGFYCHRHVLAADEEAAVRKAFKRVRSNLDRGCTWVTSGRAILSLEADEVSEDAFHKLLKPDMRGHVFYDVED
ncbi:hypothetical protein [Sphingomonas jatrophae]|uniref:hypothetical protein n=1 Tax=Sphingomonas jatrophae TaxID=1166337 RepID=UPI00104251D3|nr:hypothetical protein [Sphingomonas jatrophae]